MVTFHINNSEGDDISEEISSDGPSFSDGGIDYFCESEMTVSRSNIPEFVYEIFPHIDQISHAEITLSKDSEKLWVHEWVDGEVIITLFIPRSVKEADNQFGCELEDNQEETNDVAKKIAPLIRERSDRSPFDGKHPESKNLNHLIKNIN